MIPSGLNDLRRFLPLTLKIILETGSTSKQGVVMRGGKKVTEAEKYKEAAAVCYINPNDMKKMGMNAGERIKLTTSVSNVVLLAQEQENPEGVVFVPKGPWINSVIDAETLETGSPQYKGMQAYIESTQDPILDLNKIMEIYKKK